MNFYRLLNELYVTLHSHRDAAEKRAVWGSGSCLMLIRLPTTAARLYQNRVGPIWSNLNETQNCSSDTVQCEWLSQKSLGRLRWAFSWISLFSVRVNSEVGICNLNDCSRFRGNTARETAAGVHIPSVFVRQLTHVSGDVKSPSQLFSLFSAGCVEFLPYFGNPPVPYFL